MARAKIAIGVFLLLMTFQAIAMDVRQYQNLRDDRRIFAGIALQGIFEGLLAANSELKTSGGKQFFCIPAGQSFNVETYISIVDGEVAYDRSNPVPRKGTIENANIAEVFLAALKRAHPCK